MINDRLSFLSNSVKLLNKFNDKSGRVLIIELKIENEFLLLISL